MLWAGAGLSVLGLLGLFWCIWQAMRARGAGLDDAALRTRLKTLVAWNIGALFLSMLGLMVVVVALLLR